MNIAVLSDIHGNHYALMQVLASAKKQNVEHLFILGDMVGYYYHPDVVMELLSEWQCSFIQGNHEGFITAVNNKETDLDTLTKKYGHGLQYAFEKLSAETLQYMSSLPHTASLHFDSVSFQICHGSPWNRDQYIYPDASSGLIQQCEVPGTDFVLMGHTHYPCCFKSENNFIANAGSVGQSRTQGGIANWAIINTANKALVFQSTPYNVSDLVKEVYRIDPQLPYLAEVLSR